MRTSARLALGTASALGLARFAYGLLLPAMSADLGWSLTEAGTVSAANGLGYLLGALATGPVVRRLGTATAFRLGMILTATALAAAATSSAYPVLLIARAAAGAAGAVVFIAGGVIASRLAVRTASAAPITIYFAGTGLGIVVSAAAVPPLGQHWRVAWVVLGLAAGLATLVSWTAARTDEDAAVVPGGRARVRPLARTAVAYLLFAAGYITYITFLSAHLADQHAPVAQVVLIWTALGLAVVAAPVLWSRPITDWPGTRALAALLGALSVGAALALAAPWPPVILASAIIYGATFMGVPAAVTALIKGGTPPADWTRTLSVFTMLFAAGQTVGPWVAGVLADGTSAAATLAWTAILCGTAAVVAATARPRRRARATPAGAPALRDGTLDATPR
ncbi:YbfB/YjiJ family MFS transporter [Micromonospora humi]|uniref:Predicted arabinose efflux permease, MFS family n=1 Tax=Micromonospora humi TaxID=745366 RepID=A0A1C5H6A8_9ACTN|nr:YbfB/YjiJ family MFS transporter [Micromonospora humi]SCG41569.1 Predicted arabinose efflux permease, MFS family [Micromonospora humi]